MHTRSQLQRCVKSLPFVMGNANNLLHRGKPQTSFVKFISVRWQMVQKKKNPLVRSSRTKSATTMPPMCYFPFAHTDDPTQHNETRLLCLTGYNGLVNLELIQSSPHISCQQQFISAYLLSNSKNCEAN